MKASKAFACVCLSVALTGGSFAHNIAMADEAKTGTTPKAVSTGGSNAGTKTEAEQAAPGTGGSKEEVVYASLSSAGAANDVYVVNLFDQKSSGTITDFGAYDSVSNLTNTSTIEQSGDKVSVSADAGEFYYQGTLGSTDLPWIYTIGYKLDGASTDAADLAGKSGKLEIRLASKQNTSVDPAFYDNYMQQVSLTLDSSLCSNIVSDGATMANSGKDKVVTHTVMPGKDASITITADVQDFAMDGFQIAAMPFSMGMDIPDTDGMIDQMTPLTEAVAQLDDGMAKIAEGNRGLADGAAQLNSGSSEFGSGLTQLSDNSASLVQGSAQIQGALASISSSLGSSDIGIDPSSLQQLPQTLMEISNGLGTMGDTLAGLNAGYAQAYGALDQAMLSIPATQVDEQAIGSLMGTVSGTSDEATVGALLQYYAGAQTVAGTYYGVKPAFEGVSQALSALTAAPGSEGSIYTVSAGLATMSDSISTALQSMDTSGLQQLAEGLNQLSANYTSFHEGLVAYTDGVSSASQGYGQLQQGISSLADGAIQLSAGTAQLADGTAQLNAGVATLPDEMQVKIDEMLSDYDKSDFEPVSFVSPKNTQVSLVQFVITTEGIVPPDAEDQVVDAPVEPGMWDRFLDLFR